MDNYSRTQTIRKPLVVCRGGVVAAQHRRAAEVGAAVLDAGGDTIDAAGATSLAIGGVEPWMSGMAGGGAMSAPWSARGATALTSRSARPVAARSWERCCSSSFLMDHGMTLEQAFTTRVST